MSLSFEDSRLVRDKWVCVMADYGANGIWLKHGSMASLSDLPVDSYTFFMLGAWQNWFESRRHDEPIPSLDRFVAYGWRIVAAIQRQLPDWTVTYFDEQRQQKVIKTTLYLSKPR